LCSKYGDADVIPVCVWCRGRETKREREINAAVVLCGALRHFDKSHSELTTPADSTLKSDWLEQLQVRRMLMDMM